MPSKDAVREALRLIHPEGPWHVSAKREKGFTGKVFAPDAEGGAAGWAVAQNRTLNAYVSIAALRPGWNGNKATKADVASVGWLWVDVDPRAGEDLDLERARLLGLLTTNLPKGIPPPSVIIDSGRGFWGLWRLAQPVVMPPADDPAWDAARASVEDRNRGLEFSFGADACHNLERICRLPGTVNRKPGGLLARVVQADASVFDLTAFPAVPDPKAGAAVAVAGRGAPALATDLPAVPFDASGRPDLPVSDRTKMLIVQGRDPDDPGRHKSRSEAFWAVVCDLARANVPDDMIAAVVLNPDFAISGHPLDQPKSRQYVARQIGRARAEADDSFDCDKEGRPFATSQRNIRLAMRKLGVVVRHDLFAGRDRIDGLEGFGPPLDDAAANRLWLLTHEQFKFRPSRDLFLTVLSDAARQNAFHPVAEYLAALRWDGIPRIGRWLATYGGADDTTYARAVGELILVAAVRRVRQPGVKFDEMLVLESPQGTNKSTALKALAVRDDWFTDDLPLNAEAKRVIEALSGKWIVEAGELKGMRQGGANHLKGLLSRTHDKARMAYDRLEREVPRQCVIVGTTNDSRYLRDTTGNRRFWPVAVTGFDLDALRRDRDQLWAEAAAREAEGAPIRLDPALWGDAAAEQDARRVEDPFYESLHVALGEEMAGKLKADDAWRIVGRVAGMRTQDDMERLGDAMRRLGFDRKQRRFGGNPEWCYVRGDGALRIVPEFGPDGSRIGTHLEGDTHREPF
ncbi:virulence-associated E family protein [Fuscovulum blasticum]|uniref:virulence-associated E family protein n=1 Tax=Fuscovulum blasticum TaxID=1075 RepID=UPI0013DFF124|nr:virulence-associated E family protein [Fuscovulum blasticum]